MNTEYKNLIILNMVSFLAFWVVAFLFYSELTIIFDSSVYSAISPIISDVTTTFMIFITNFGGTQSIIILCLLLLLYPKTRKTFGIPISAVAIFSSISNELVKSVFERERPDILRLIEVNGFSFPSGHTMNNMAIYTMLALILLDRTEHTLKNRLLISSIYLLPITIGFSRIYLGVHYPSDVLAGLFAGFWAGSSMFLLFKYLIINEKYSL